MSRGVRVRGLQVDAWNGRFQQHEVPGDLLLRRLHLNHPHLHSRGGSNLLLHPQLQQTLPRLLQSILPVDCATQRPIIMQRAALKYFDVFIELLNSVSC